MGETSNYNWLSEKWRIAGYNSNPNDCLRVRQSCENKTAIMMRITNLLGVRPNKFTQNISEGGFLEAYASCDIPVNDEMKVNLQVSTDTVNAYLKVAAPTAILLFKIYIRHVRFTGSANDIWLDDVARLTVDMLWYSMMKYREGREKYVVQHVTL